MTKHEGVLVGTPLTKNKRRWWRFALRHLPAVSFALLVAWLIIVVLWPHMMITVPSGSVGVMWYRFLGFDPYCWCFAGRGTVLDPRELREEGFHMVAPWNKLFIYTLRLQSSLETVNAISKDGVTVTAQINVRYQLVHDAVGVLHKFIGPNYFSSVVVPEIGSQARLVISRYTAEDVYTSREKIQDEIRENAQKSMASNLNKLVQPAAMEQPNPRRYTDFLQNSILILDTLVLSLKLPPDIVAAINQQAEQYYMIQEYRYRVQREAEEAQRKMIEANGIAAFQSTVSKGISDSYLRWRGIEATLALAQSPNAKIVVIGAGKDGLPIILGNVGTPTAAGAAAKAGAGAPTAPARTPSPQAGESWEGATAPAALERERAAAAAAARGAIAGVDGSPAAGLPKNVPSGRSTPSGTFSPLDASDWESLLSRIYGAVRPRGPAPPAATEAKP